MLLWCILCALRKPLAYRLLACSKELKPLVYEDVMNNEITHSVGKDIPDAMGKPAQNPYSPHSITRDMTHDGIEDKEKSLRSNHDPWSFL